MSFLKITHFLTSAFQRIDTTQQLKETKEKKTILTVLQKHYPSIDAEVRHNAIIIYSHSPTLNQKIRFHESRILKEIGAIDPTLVIYKILFKGPRS